MKENFNAIDEIDYDPIEAYNKNFKTKHKELSKKYINDIIEQSGIDVSTNKEESKKYRKYSEINDKLKRKGSIFKGILISISILTIVALLIASFLYVSLKWFGTPITLFVVFPIIFIASLSLFLTLIIKNNKIRKNNKEILIKHYEKAKELIAPVFPLIKHGIREKLLTEACSIIKFDKYLRDETLFEYKINFGFEDPYDSKNSSCVFLQSGYVLNNPFVIKKNLTMTMGTKNYYGSITISWTEYSTDANGTRRAVLRTQTLTAHVTKSYPYYNTQNVLYYLNNAAPNLKFTREFSHIEKLSEKEYKKHINKMNKVFTKMDQEAIKEGRTFKSMSGNLEFESIFNAKDRNNELEYRLLFTPLAQKSMKKVLLDKNNYGDDFSFIKFNKINALISEHLNEFPLATNEKLFYETYDVDILIDNFLKYQENYFKNIYHSFAPIFAIPLYLNTPYERNIYEEDKQMFMSEYDLEYYINLINPKLIAHENSKTQNINKIIGRYKNIESGYDEIDVISSGFDSFERVDYISVRGGDGKLHSVPVTWYEYVPVSAKSRLHVKALNKYECENDETNQNYENDSSIINMNKNSTIINFIRKM
ncbi:Uncharacterised protein [Mycoplasmopsis maculosa]|uniref:Uncharacterized protein n=1 Tax=Mycoplasmopsis maculosa TaxID=114885 RepID=A0A449B4L8_9BACT|nr:hypothetical protein [Mycoplasmopsis maculosa]VEU75547.1 Uncharacterised protein [Mycoplasmopsis maculosa]